MTETAANTVHYKVYGMLLGEREDTKTSYYMWCARSGETNILIDTGLSDPEVRRRNLVNVASPAEQLKKIDVDPATVGTIIITHLHSDHFSACHLYPKATFHIQKRDIEFFVGPAVRFKQVTKAAVDMTDVVRFAFAGRIRYLDGDEEVRPGIRVALVGGHTPGSQVVVIDTKRGKVVVCGDAIHTYRNLEEGVPGPEPMNLVESLLSVEKIRAQTSCPELIVPGHDALIMKRFPSPKEGIIEIG
ncbi:MAG: N-acyl homoserine lactonase family protein [Chloroflexi bacterium]|nr:N-acyl homoserine lactonase family protein [Chloroflexota bacterium]